MALTNQYLEVIFGAEYLGLSTVGYTLYDSAGVVVVARTAVGVFELGTNTGIYGAVVPAVADNVATIVWDINSASPFASEDMSQYLQQDAVLTDTASIDSRLPPDPADESLQQAAHAATQAAIVALNDIDQTVVQAALTAQGYTAARAPSLDNLDASISSRSDFDEALNPVEILDTGGTAGTSASELVADVGSNLSGAHGAGQWDAVNLLAQQDIRDAMKLSPTAGAPAVGSVDEQLVDILVDTAAIDARLPSDPADESLQQAAHTSTQASITALNDLSQADVQTALTTQGYTAARSTGLDNLDATVSSRSDFDESLNPVEILDSGGAAGTSAAELVVDTETALGIAHGTGQWDAVNALAQQDIRDAMKLSPSVGAPDVGSVDEHLDDIVADTAAVDGRLPASPADESLQQAAHNQTQSDIAALNNLSQAGVQSAMTLQGYTSVRATNLDNLDATISSIAAALSLLNDLSQADIQLALTAQGYTVARAVLIDNLDATVSSVVSAIAALNDLDQAAVQLAMTTQGYTVVRAALIDNLDSSVSGIPAAVDVLLTANHGPGPWISSASSSDWTSAERDEIRGALGVTGVQSTPGGGGLLQDVLSALVVADLSAVAGSTASVIQTGATQVDNFYKDLVVLVVNTFGTVARSISAYAQVNGSFTVAPALPFTPSPGDRVLILGRVGSDTTLSAAVASVQNQVDKIDSLATVGLGAAVSGSLLDRICNKNSGKTYNQATDSLEAIRDRSG